MGNAHCWDLCQRYGHRRPVRACRCVRVAASCSLLYSQSGIKRFQLVAPDLFSPRAHARMGGDDTFWMAEHHFQPEGTELIPNLLMMAMHLCGVTKNINIGC